MKHFNPNYLSGILSEPLYYEESTTNILDHENSPTFSNENILLTKEESERQMRLKFMKVAKSFLKGNPK